jgi:integrase
VRHFVGSKRAAGALLNELGAELGGEGAPTLAPGSLSELLERYCSDREGLGRSAVTVAEYRRKAATDIGPRLGSAAVRDLSTGDVDAFYRELTRAGYGAASVKAIHKLLHGALGAAVRWGMAAHNPAHLATPPAHSAAKVKAPAPGALLESVDSVGAGVAAGTTGHGWRRGARDGAPHLAALLTFAAMTGLRRGEACALRWSDIDFEARTLHVARSLTSPKGERYREGPTKSGRDRIIPLGAIEVAELMAHRLSCEVACQDAAVAHDPRGFVFTMPSHPSGAVPMRPDYVSRRTRELTGGALHPHATRHFYASELNAAHVDPAVASELLGHADGGKLYLDTYTTARDENRDATAGLVARRLRP